ncbi:AAA family ATPase [Tuwongella immobilis]|nr:AAA family ATPase [Tuwongella immobilis]
MHRAIVDRLQSQVMQPLKTRFVGREEVVDLIALALVAGEHLFLYGPPGTAKSALIRAFAQAVGGSYFEYLLTRFSEPNEIFGPIDLVRLRDGIVATVTQGMLPEAAFVFLDELFNANSAILNNLLTVLNERTYRRGAEQHRLPLLSLFSASNHLPEDDALNALFDRFLLRHRVEPLTRDAMPQLLMAGWELEQTKGLPAIAEPQPIESPVTVDDLRQLGQTMLRVELAPIRDSLADAIFKVRDLGVAISDRRAVKILKLVAASAVLAGRMQANPSDFWVLRYVWDRESQVAPLRSLVLEMLRQHAAQSPHEAAHPMATIPERITSEQLAQELSSLEQQLNAGKPTLTLLARLREQTTRLADRAAWLTDPAARQVVTQRMTRLLERLGT